MRWDLVDSFEVLKKGSVSKAWKSFDGTEDFFQGHFPSKPVVPGTLLIEMIAQAGGVLYGLGLDFKKEVILAKIALAFFPKEVFPPCRLWIEANLEKEREEGAWVSGTVKLNGELVANAEILLVTMDALEEGRQESVVFNDGFLKHYDIYNVAKASQS